MSYKGRIDSVYVESHKTIQNTVWSLGPFLYFRDIILVNSREVRRGLLFCIMVFQGMNIVGENSLQLKVSRSMCIVHCILCMMGLCLFQVL